MTRLSIIDDGILVYQALIGDSRVPWPDVELLMMANNVAAQTGIPPIKGVMQLPGVIHLYI